MAKFSNAEFYKRTVVKPGAKATYKQFILALGPVHSFSVQDFQTSKPRTFDVGRDEKGDLLFLLVPASPRQKPQKAYLVGGVVRERGSGSV